MAPRDPSQLGHEDPLRQHPYKPSQSPLTKAATPKVDRKDDLENPTSKRPRLPKRDLDVALENYMLWTASGIEPETSLLIKKHEDVKNEKTGKIGYDAKNDAEFMVETHLKPGMGNEEKVKNGAGKR